MEYIRNRKTVQIMLENCKTKKFFDQNRKRNAKSENMCTRLGSLRRIFSEDKQEKYKTASNSKSENLVLFCRKPKIKSEMGQKPQTTMVAKTEKAKVFWYKNRKTDLRNGRNRKTENPNPHLRLLVKFLCFLYSRPENEFLKLSFQYIVCFVRPTKPITT